MHSLSTLVSYSLHVREGVDIGQQIRQLRSGVDVAVGTPGRFIDLINRGNLDLRMVSVALCILCMRLEWGHLYIMRFTFPGCQRRMVDYRLPSPAVRA